MSSWDDLEHELDLWAASGRRATFWWRDDDAVSQTPALERLLALARAQDVPLSLAVIPRGADAKLSHLLREQSVTVLQHGYAHENHAGPDGKKCELGGDRPLSRTLDELHQGQDRLVRLFGDRFLTILVPPWNRIDPAVTVELAALGFFGLSRYTPRKGTHAASGLLEVNTHVDPIAWRRDRSFLGTGPAIDLVIAHLRGRRNGEVDPGEPTGLLTHHRDHDEPCWRFLGKLLERTAAHPASAWLGAGAAFCVTCAR